MRLTLPATLLALAGCHGTEREWKPVAHLGAATPSPTASPELSLVSLPGQIALDPASGVLVGNGDVEAELVFVNYGIPSDYEELEKMGIEASAETLNTAAVNHAKAAAGPGHYPDW